jgi:hypothetical protein
MAPRLSFALPVQPTARAEAMTHRAVRRFRCSALSTASKSASISAYRRTSLAAQPVAGSRTTRSGRVAVTAGTMVSGNLAPSLCLAQPGRGVTASLCRRRHRRLHRHRHLHHRPCSRGRRAARRKRRDLSEVSTSPHTLGISSPTRRRLPSTSTSKTWRCGVRTH